MKKTLVLGASPNPDRYAYKAAKQLKRSGHEVLLVGIKKGTIDGMTIENGLPLYEAVDTITLYVGPANQVAYYDYILALKPKRLIFNPGTENPELNQLAQKAGIETERACTLVMLSVGNY